ncbi:hypothetical protein M440DRAFT_1450890 [Trichoderma longibrachiatum ATCC 18648]|uniref:Uncharacterized protein n=1 Tax=Trichoderma longibrachiatum ATCC 18648 TaxID=983965 RepID=A0A2T4CGM5_TRILO|nr:hypothetical protein M440DRAFT_1450890 [Trichoderma longibrachiatum ATCC 18648]
MAECARRRGEPASLRLVWKMVYQNSEGYLKVKGQTYSDSRHYKAYEKATLHWLANLSSPYLFALLNTVEWVLSRLIAKQRKVPYRNTLDLPQQFRGTFIRAANARASQWRTASSQERAAEMRPPEDSADEFAPSPACYTAQYFSWQSPKTGSVFRTAALAVKPRRKRANK